MKNLNLLVLVSAITLVFTSCSTNETILPEEQSVDLLKTYTIKRDATGAYSIDFELNDGAEVDKVYNTETSTNQYHLFSSENTLSKRVNQNLNIDGDQLKVGFIDRNSNNLPNITLTDDDIRLAKKNDSDKLKEYSVASNSDGTFTLDFNVANNVKVDFVYNEDIDTYEVHLEDGKSTTKEYSRVLEKENGKSLKLDFVNHSSNTQGRGTLASIIRRKPKVIIDNGEGVGELY